MLHYIGKDTAKEINNHYKSKGELQNPNPWKIGHEEYNKIPDHLKPQHIGVHPEYDLGLILLAAEQNPNGDTDVDISLTGKQINQCVTVEQIKSILSNKITVGGDSYIYSIVRSLNTMLPKSLSEQDIKDIAGYINHEYIGGGEKYDKFTKLISTPEAQTYIALLAGANKLIKKLFDPQLNNIIRKILYGKEDTGVALIQHYSGKYNKQNIDFLLQFDSFTFEDDGTIKGTVNGVNAASKTRTLTKVDDIWTTLGDPIQSNPLRMDGLLERIQIKTQPQTNFGEHSAVVSQYSNLEDTQKILHSKLLETMQPVDDIVNLIDEEYKAGTRKGDQQRWDTIYQRWEENYKSGKLNIIGTIHLHEILRQIERFISSQEHQSIIEEISLVISPIIDDFISISNKIFNLQKE